MVISRPTSGRIFNRRSVILLAICLSLLCLLLLHRSAAPDPNSAKGRLLAIASKPPVELNIRNPPLSAADQNEIRIALAQAGAAALETNDVQASKGDRNAYSQANKKKKKKKKEQKAGFSAKQVYVHIPKTGGTKVEGYLGETLDKELSRDPKQVLNKVGRRCTKKHIPPAWFTVAEVSPYRNTESFTILRNPYARLISEYKYMCWGPRKTGTMKKILGKTDLGPIEVCKRNVEQMNDYFDAILPKVNQEPELAHLTDCHFVPQTVYVEGVDHVFCTAQEVRDHILAKFPGVDKKEVATFRDPKLYDSVAKKFRPEVLRKINHEYAGDFKLCGWEMLDEKDLTS